MGRKPEPHFDGRFADVDVTGLGIVEAVRYYTGIRYSREGTFVTETPDGPKGFCDCAGALLLAARRLELLPADFDCNIPPSRTGMSRHAAMLQILTLNFTRVSWDGRLPGDVLVLKWSSQSDGEFGRHLAAYVGDSPAPHGSLIHGINDISGQGKLFEQPIDGHLVPLIWRVYRLNQLVGASNDG